MKVKRRHRKLVEIIREKESASVEELAGRLEASRETIRRDLTKLSRQGKIQKVHGGAVMPNVFAEGPFQQRMSENAGAKMRIATAAAELFHPGETLFINTGSTSLYFAEELASRSGLTIVTNSTEIAKTVSIGGKDNETFLLGGAYVAGNRQTLGPMVTNQVNDFSAHHTILAIGALTPGRGVMEFRHDEAELARAMLKRSRSLTILTDASKFTGLASFSVCDLGCIDRLVCDSMPPAEILAELEPNGCEIIVV